MTQGKRYSLILSFTGQRRYSHADYRFSQNTNERQMDLALSHQWLKEIRQNVITIQRQREFLHWSCRETIEKIRDRSDPNKITKNCLYRSGITEIFLHWNYYTTTAINSLAGNWENLSLAQIQVQGNMILLRQIMPWEDRNGGITSLWPGRWIH